MPLADQGRQSWGPGVGHTPVFERVCVSGYSQYERPNSSSGNRVKVKSEKSQTFSRLLAALSFHRKCSVRLKFIFGQDSAPGTAGELTMLPRPPESAEEAPFRTPLDACGVPTFGPSNIDNRSTRLHAVDNNMCKSAQS